MTLTEAQKKYLRGLGHALKPVVMISDAGLSDAVRAELESALEHHELIKVSVRVGDRKARDTIIGTLCDESGAVLIQRIGNVALVYRQNSETKKIRLPGG
jgi:RNA-binding protein